MLSLQQLQELARTYTRKDGNLFYRKLYALGDEISHLDIRSTKEWQTLPPLKKQNVTGVPFGERLFIPLQDLDTISVTSGTTGGPPLFQPRSYQGEMLEGIIGNFPAVQGAWLAGILQFPHEHERALSHLNRPVRVVQFDPKHIHESLRLALTAGAEVIVAQTYFVSAMCEAARKLGLADRIRLVVGAGEAWTRSEFLRVRDVFKNAAVYCNYGTREVGTIAYTKALDAAYEVVYRPMTHVYLEIVQPGTADLVTPRPGAEGELLITTTVGKPSAFPFLRYRIGDFIRIEHVSENGADFTFKLLGRPQLEYIKMPGGMLRVDEIVRVVEMFPDKISDQFEAHCYEEDTPEGPKKRVVMHIEPRGAADLDDVAGDIAGELRLGPSLTYGDGVRKGLYLPLACAPLQKSAGGAKRRRIVKHW